MALKFVQAPTAAIALPMGDSDTSFYGLDIKDINGNYLSMTDFGTIGYMTINPTSPFAEIVSFTGCVYQGDGTTLFTGVTRGLLAIDPYTTGGTAYAHSPNDSIVFSINPQMLDQFVQKGQDATITGTFTFLYTKMPRASQTVTYGVGSDLWFATKEYVDGVAVAGAPNASTSTKGIGRVSVPPADPTIPIFVGDNDPRVPGADVSGLTQDMINAIEAGNAPTGSNPFMTFADSSVLSAADKIVRANASGKIDPSYIQNFAGDGSDGALAVSSGTTNIDLGGAQVVIKQYTSISITGTGAVTFSNPHANGTIIILKSQGNVTLTSSTIPNLDASGMGAAGGAGGTGSASGSGQQNNGGTSASIVTNYQDSTSSSVGVGGTANSVNGGAAASAFTNQYMYTLTTVGLTKRTIVLAPGNGGGGGSGGQSQLGGGGTLAGGAGGRGGGALVIQCGGALNFTSALGIDVSGKNGSNGTAYTSGGGSQGGGAGGGGGGGAGMCLVLYNTLTAASGTVNAKGGNGGNGGNVTVTGTGGGSAAGAGGGGSGGATLTSVSAAGATAPTVGGGNANGNTGSSGAASSGAGGGGGSGSVAASGTAYSGTGGTGGTGGTTNTSLWLITKNYYQA